MGGERERYKKCFFVGEGRETRLEASAKEGSVCWGPILSVSFCECVGVAEWPSPVEDGKGGEKEKTTASFLSLEATLQNVAS